MTRIVTASPGTCRECNRKRDVYSASRRGGGSYNRAPRRYVSSICGECATSLLDGATPDHDPQGWDATHLDDIVASVDTDEARRVVAAWENEVAKKAERSRQADEQMKVYFDRVAEHRQIMAWVRAQADDEWMDAETCHRLAEDLRRNTSAGPNAGLKRVEGGGTAYDKTMRQRIIDFILGPSETLLHAPTCRMLALGIEEGKHVPADGTEQEETR